MNTEQFEDKKEWMGYCSYHQEMQLVAVPGTRYNTSTSALFDVPRVAVF